ncbi:MAG: class I SAM-dependent methyltransferase, partial [Bacteroidota bacterium]
MGYKKIIIKPKREASLLRKHPWVFSGGVAVKEGNPVDGDLVEVFNKRGEFLGVGHFTDGSIMVRILSFEQVAIDPVFWENKFKAAFTYRASLGFLNDPGTDCFRLIHAEGDGVPGLIIDLYGDTAVVQCHSIGMYQQLDVIAKALIRVSEGRIQNVYQKSKETLPNQFSKSIQNGYLIGAAGEGIVNENGHRFIANWETGQKTGFFLDQRDNRKRLEDFVKDKTVLNTFCYTGGFSVYALAAGAAQVDSVDISSKAMEIT